MEKLTMTDFETHPIGTAKRIEELEAKLAKALSIACELSGCVDYDYHGNVIGQETRKAMAELDKLLQGVSGV